jgi:hypothetical protein
MELGATIASFEKAVLTPFRQLFALPFPNPNHESLLVWI